MRKSSFKHLILIGLSISIIFVISNCGFAYFTTDYAKIISKYLKKGDGKWSTSYWDYYKYFRFSYGGQADSVIVDTIMYPDYIWVFTDEDGVSVHDSYRKGYIELNDGSQQIFDWDVYGNTQYEEHPTIYFEFPDTNNIFNSEDISFKVEYYKDNLLRFSTYDGYYETNGTVKEETLIELER